jgi:transcriptional regulator with XRE-family HTH domain
MAKNVQDLCQEKSLSLLELADRTGIDLPKLRAIFLGRWTPSPQERQQIAAALGCTIDDIAWGHNTPIQHIYGHGPG